MAKLSWNGVKKIASNPIVNIATGGLSGAVVKASQGDFKGAAIEQVTGGLVSGAKAGAKAISKAGISSQAGTAVKSADAAGYQAASDNLLNPVADQYSQLGQQGGITSNVDPAFRNYQMGLAQQLQAQANGQGPSIAQMQLQQATDRTLNQSLGTIRAATGANAGLSARTAALAGAQQLGQAGNASGQLRLQEQQQAQQMLAGVANQGLQGDLQTNAQSIQAQQASFGNKLGALNGLSGIRQGQLGTAQNIYAAQNGAQMQTSQNKNARTNAYIGGISNIASTGLDAYTSGGVSLAVPKAPASGTSSQTYDSEGNPIGQVT